MSNSWAKGAPSTKGPTSRGPGSKPASTGKMRYVPPPARAQEPAAVSAQGKGRMKYVPPPKDAGVWVRPQPKPGGNDKWEELAAKEDAQLKASRKFEVKSAAKQEKQVRMSGNDKADMMATKTECDIWSREDILRTLAWSRAEECRIPNKRVAKGGRLHKLINILLNNCEFVNERLSREKRYLDATRDPTLPNGLELKRRFVAPLAKRVLNKVEEEEIEKSLKDDDPDSDDSEGMAM